ncbi:DnaJ heat shock protein family (Hsp40) member C3 [Phyllostomus discolor]|uniref:DnaJ heat shock protein family (Hsp40) member C3 n=1 Tax=Phyllostomus discolor TaxID=89673 RepID=A0A834DHR9_9CHIR|nr:DnaJ heat shock protein family (Hsp40) member C3 [Phyllostomus discolor]
MVAPSSVTSRLGSVFPFLLVLVDLQYEGAECGVNADVEKHLELGKKLLAAGQLADALSQFHAAVGLCLGSRTLSGPTLVTSIYSDFLSNFKHLKISTGF